ncbi:hypothetical protein A3H38_04745 [candidate division WOR-1 bacterium RIFCSPLOWO2_02_FULL_46_20]|uniref:Ribosomal RNA small subunit methyltransferase E n=2 Tax=Saganbacteria TaxID=1703751 RepID=A0A1F4RB91_UNCSA|nr:MAG: hypothetical protein A3J44_00300 [candidate division WOR-1 bacterium RIFCSPHIGHO2_02_FULL_45_12]OGC05420.1 MAG: hypothetical protein A3H38_04745 [candidate division WOR-1 bacterium RIFCSPLOWO2_02_FULL_46_20]OGC08989.1 MAG: hypothetical protein A3F86_06250 [candidate division WOR-1 bacterium RIFCSPLOWO2_12_FULL_45_9]
MHRFFVPQEQIPTITGSDAHQIKNVLRLKVGEKIELLDGSGKVYFATIENIGKDKVVCNIIEHRTPNTEDRTQITIAQCLPKAKKMDLIIQKCTELGVSQIIPTLSERSIAKADKPERWSRIAREAAEQSGRLTIPIIAPLTKFEDVLKIKKDFSLALIPWELEKEKTLKSVLPDNRISGYPVILILIGPEGGFSRVEVEHAKSTGFIPISLGPRILRTETASLSILSIINYEYEQRR